MKRTLTFFAVAALSAAMVSSCAKNSGTAGDMADSTKMMAAAMDSTNKAAANGFYNDVINAHNPAAIDKYVASNFVDHNPDPGHTGKGSDDLKKSMIDWFSFMPDMHVTPDRMVSDGDMVWVMNTMTGTMKGDMGGMKATNKSAKVGGVDIMRIKDGKAVEHWGYFDQMAMMNQLGLMPPPPGDMKKK